MNDERACVDVTERIDETDDTARAAQVESRKCVTECVQVEERVSGQYVFSMEHEPVVDDPLLGRCRVEFIPRICATTSGS
jgi:hypothetical protein